MAMKTLSRSLFYGLTSLVLIGNGALLLRWFLEPPNPNRVDYLLIVYFFALDVLGALGLLALIFRNWLKLPWWLGAALLAYPGLSYAGVWLAVALFPTLDGTAVYRLLAGLHGLLWALSVGCVVASIFGQGRPPLAIVDCRL
jgi:hypothetical protein